MENKKSFKHLANNNSNQVDPRDFIQFMQKMAQYDYILTDSEASITEKFDGSPIFVGYDEKGFFMEKYGIKEKLREISTQEFFLPYIDLFDFFKFSSAFKELTKEFHGREVKFIFEGLIKEANKSQKADKLQIVLMDYDLNKIPKSGVLILLGVLVDGVPYDDLNLVESLLNKRLLNSSYEFCGNPEKEFEIDLSNEGFAINQLRNLRLLDSRKASEKFLKQALKDSIYKIQKTVQDKILQAIPTSSFGDCYEGLVVETIFGFDFKITSEKFKSLMAQRKKERG